MAEQEKNIYAAELADIPEIYPAEDIIKEELMLPMTDGTRLETYIYRPDLTKGKITGSKTGGLETNGKDAECSKAGGLETNEKTDEKTASGKELDEEAAASNHTGKIPVILTRSPYAGAFPYYEMQAMEFAKRGMAFAIQFCRGTGKSEGEWVPNIYDRGDGLDTMNYLASLDWVENIGYYGGSYVAFTGWIMADAVPEKVKGMYLAVYGTDRHISAYKDGLFRQDILTAWAMGNAGFPIEADYLESCSYMPQAQVDHDLWKADLPWYRDWITHTDYTDPYWQTGVWDTLKHIPEKIKYPIVIEEGWYDHHLGGALVGYRSLTGKAKENALLRVGCWNHGKNPVLQDRTSNNLKNEQVAPAYRFFDSVLRGNGKLQTGVDLYVVGEDRWLAAEDWPSEIEEKKFYLDCSKLQADTKESAPAEESAGIQKTGIKATAGQLSEEGKNTSGSLLPSPAEAAQTDYIYDPKNPVMSHGTESCFKLMHEVGSLLQPEPGYCPDVISFVSEPLEEPLTIIGQPQVDLYVSSDAEDTAFTMKVMEVFENGKAYNIRSGITTLAYRGHSDTRQTYTPGEIVKVNIDSWDIAWTLQKGSRLRVDISSSDFPQYTAHSNYPGIWALQEKSKPAKQTIYTGKDYPACLKLPVMQIGDR